MTPLEFTLENAMEILPDAYRRKLSAEARKCAEEGAAPRSDFGEAKNFWDAVVNEHKRLIWTEAYEKRKARLARISGTSPSQGRTA